MSVIRIRDEAELYNRFDPTQTRLSNDAYSYLKSLLQEMDAGERKNDIIQIQCDGEIDLDRAKKAIYAAVMRDIDDYNQQLGVNKLKMIRLYVIGIALIVIGFALALVLDQLILEVISIVGSMAVKDAATIQIQHNPELRIKRRMLESLLDVKVETV